MKEEYIVCGSSIPFSLDNKSIGEYYFSRISIYNEQTAQIYARSEKSINYQEFKSIAQKVTAGFRERNIGIDDVVLVGSGGDLDYVPLLMGTWFAGGIFAPIDPSLLSDENVHVINLYKPKIIFCTESNVGHFVEALKKSGMEIEIIVMNTSKSGKEFLPRNAGLVINLKSFKEFLDSSRTSEKTITPVQISDPEDKVCAIMPSSGTSGLPKGIMMSHMAVQRSLMILSNDKINFPVYNNVILSTNPFWLTGFMTILLSLKYGRPLIIIPQPTAEEMLQTIEKYKPKYLFLPPSIVMSISKTKFTKSYDLSSVRKMIVGGSPLSKETLDAVRKNYSIEVVNSYGSTEVHYISIQPSGKFPYDDDDPTGMALVQGTKIKVICTDTGKALGPNQEGEIYTWTPCFMNGYINNPEAIKEAVDSEGWYHTGDIGYYNNKGELFITNRIKDLIKYRGYHISPAELEGILLTHPEVKDVAVIGVPNEDDGQHPMAFIVLKESSTTSSEALINMIKDKLSQNKWLRGGIKFVQQIPKNSNGKILRKELIKMV